MNRLSPLLAVLALLPPLSLSGQDSTGAATPFRKGQWAAQFQAGTAFGSLGFIKFRSPTRALVLDLRIGGQHAEELTTDSSGSNQFSSLNSNAFGQLRFGWRRYGGDGRTAKIVSHYSLGVLGGFSHSASRTVTDWRQTNSWTAGAFGDVGGTYLLTPKFGIGALATATLSYQNGITRVSSGRRSRNWSIGGSALGASLVATVFF
jgi:hypothetical protein